MSLTIEVPYFNSYVLKKISDVPYTDSAVTPAVVLPWNAPPSADVDQDWYVEESRIRGGYNNTSTDYGVKAYIVEDNDDQSRLSKERRQSCTKRYQRNYGTSKRIPKRSFENSHNF